MDGVNCIDCDLSDEINQFHSKYVNSGLIESDEMKIFKQILLENNNRLNIHPSSIRKIMK